MKFHGRITVSNHVLDNNFGGLPQIQPDQTYNKGLDLGKIPQSIPIILWSGCVMNGMIGARCRKEIMAKGGSFFLLLDPKEMEKN